MKTLRYLFLIFFILFFTSSVSVSAKELQILYLFKNTSVNEVTSISEFYFRQNNFLLKNTNKNYFIAENSVNYDDYYFVSFEQCGKDVLFYLESNIQDKNFQKNFLNRFKIKKVKYKKINSELLSLQKSQYADNVLSDEKFNRSEEQIALDKNLKSYEYDFSDEAQAVFESANNTYLLKANKENVDYKIQKSIDENSFMEFNKPDENNSKSNISIQKEPVSITVDVSLQSPVTTRSLEKEDLISCLLQNDLYVNNKLVAEKDSVVYGTVKCSKKAGAAYSDGALSINFDRILTLSGNTLNIDCDPIVYEMKTDKKSLKIAGNILCGAALAVALDLLISKSYRDGENNYERRNEIFTAAAAGAVLGGLNLVNQKGEDVNLNSGATLQIRIISIN